MKNATVIIAAALVAAGCEKSKEPGTAAAPAAPSAPTPAPAAAAKSADLASLFPGKAPKLPPPFTPLGFRSTDDDAKKLLPEGPNKRLSLEQFGGDIGLARVELWANDIESKAWARSVQVRIKAPVDEVKGKMTAAWGSPQPSKSKGWVWINLPDGIQAILKSDVGGAEVVYEPVMEWQAFLGNGKGLGFEKGKPLVGMSPDDVEKTYAIEYYPDADKKRMMLNFPELPGNDNGGTKVMIDTDGGKVKGYQATLDFDGYPEPAKLVQQINARITEKWGKPSKKWLNYRNFGKKPTTTVTVNPTQFVFSVK